MKNQEIRFSIQGQHTSHKGTAEVVNFWTSGMVAALTFFENDNTFKTNVIGIFSKDEVRYRIYENYIDSGSDDYYYFAIEIIEE